MIAPLLFEKKAEKLGCRQNVKAFAKLKNLDSILLIIGSPCRFSF